eukprot:TRINITY_DN3689_c0_g2_i6.p1 TRINITY_DN3689_c0_g2~~TRINITY_DN3689_c0_g2_i6.p1  ORF type:complete len:239 (+),score=27.55 TRINITY_DN3689_c0_g2_i6:92-808(+)
MKRLLARTYRSCGQSLNRLGLALQGSRALRETLSPHRRILPVYNQTPHLEDNLFIAPNTTIVGKAKIAQGTSIWYGTVIRADSNEVTIGSNTNVGDRCVIHVPTGVLPDLSQTVIGNNVYIGTGCVLSGCEIEDSAHIEAGCKILEGAVVGSQSRIGSGSVVQPQTKILPRQFWSGNPATYQRDLTSAELQDLEQFLKETLVLSEKHTYWHELTSQEKYNVERVHLKRSLRRPFVPKF